MNVVSYLRVSSRGQVEGDGPERQRDEINKLCRAHQLVHVREYFEKAVKGETEGLHRPKFTELLEALPHYRKNGIWIQAIVVERMDRLARDLMVSEVLLLECRKRKLKVFAADQGVLIDLAADDADPTRVLIRQVLGALAQWEKASLVRKLKAARDRIRAETGWCGGQLAYGTKPGEIEILRYMQALRDDGYSWRQIALELNIQDLRARKNRTWSHVLVRETLTNHQKRIAKLASSAFKQ